MTYPAFNDDIKRMNKTYELPSVQRNLTAMDERLEKFADILLEEFKEINEVANSDLCVFRTNLADLLGDIIVYCASEAVRWNIPLPAVLKIIMASNFSKLGADGKPIKDERGKFLKGPNYWKPEAGILTTIEHYDRISTLSGERLLSEVEPCYVPQTSSADKSA